MTFIKQGKANGSSRTYERKQRLLPPPSPLPPLPSASPLSLSPQPDKKEINVPYIKIIKGKVNKGIKLDKNAVRIILKKCLVKLRKC